MRCEEPNLSLYTIETSHLKKLPTPREMGNLAKTLVSGKPNLPFSDAGSSRRTMHRALEFLIWRFGTPFSSTDPEGKVFRWIFVLGIDFGAEID